MNIPTKSDIGKKLRESKELTQTEYFIWLFTPEDKYKAEEFRKRLDEVIEQVVQDNQ